MVAVGMCFPRVVAVIFSIALGVDGLDQKHSLYVDTGYCSVQNVTDIIDTMSTQAINVTVHMRLPVSTSRPKLNTSTNVVANSVKYFAADSERKHACLQDLVDIPRGQR